MANRTLKIFVAEGCRSCGEIKRLVKDGKIATNCGPNTEVKLVDVTTDEGFPDVEREKLTGVPSARFEGHVCNLSIDEDTKTLIVDCADEAKSRPDASEQAK